MDTLTSWLLVVIVTLATVYAVVAWAIWTEHRHDIRTRRRKDDRDRP